MTTIDRPEMVTHKFSEICSDETLVAKLKSLNITDATEVQSKAIPAVLSGGDLIVEAQTGSGKTLAFLVPVISKIRSSRSSTGPSAIVLTPTRELATQVQKVAESIAPEIKTACIIGGASSSQQEKALRDGARIVIGTPGRILDLINRRSLILRRCETFVLDEADEMLSMGFVNEVKRILRSLPTVRQGLFFSATISDRVKTLSYDFLKSPKVIAIEKVESKAPQIEHFFCTVDGSVSSKTNFIAQYLQREKVDSAIIFCNTKSDTELVEVVLKRRNLNARRINSDLSQKERVQVLNALRTGAIKYLVATDVAARGIDIKELELVINYSLHDQHETYVHRVGRTGRNGAKGKAISLIGPADTLAFMGIKRNLPDQVITEIEARV